MTALREYIKQAACKKNPGEGRDHGPRGKALGSEGMTGVEKTALDEAYEEGVKLALAEFMEKMGTGRSYTVPGKPISLPDLKAQTAGKPTSADKRLASSIKPRLTKLKGSV